MKKAKILLLAALMTVLMLAGCETKHVVVSVPKEAILEELEKEQAAALAAAEKEIEEEPVEEEPLPEEPEQEKDVSAQGKQLLDAFIAAEGKKTDEVQVLLDEISAQNPRMGEGWTELLDTWQDLNGGFMMNWRAVPKDLPQDNSLCIVILGYELGANGTMQRELTGRLETAQKCIDAYPDAWILVTGGPTAPKVPENTEADLMAKWLVDHGASEDQILIENKAMTTVENALYSGELLRQHPEITDLMIVTSDYHMKRGIMAFSTEMLLGGGEAKVVSNFARMVGTNAGGFTSQAADVRMVADAHW